MFLAYERQVGKKISTNSTAWLWFWDIKETQNCYIWKKILSHHGDSTWHTQPIQPKYGRILWLGTTSPPIWLKISFHFCQFWVPFLSLNHNQAVEIIELFFPLSYPSNIGCTVFKFTFLFTFTKFVYICQLFVYIISADFLSGWKYSKPTDQVTHF